MWHMFVIPAFWKLGQEDQEFKASLYGKSYLQNKLGIVADVIVGFNTQP